MAFTDLQRDALRWTPPIDGLPSRWVAIVRYAFTQGAGTALVTVLVVTPVLPLALGLGCLPAYGHHREAAGAAPTCSSSTWWPTP